MKELIVEAKIDEKDAVKCVKQLSCLLPNADLQVAAFLCLVDLALLGEPQEDYWEAVSALQKV